MTAPKPKATITDNARITDALFRTIDQAMEGWQESLGLLERYRMRMVEMKKLLLDLQEELRKAQAKSAATPETSSSKTPGTLPESP